MNEEITKQAVLNGEYYPEGLPEAGHITCIEVNDKGYRFKRLHPYYNGEEFFLTIDSFNKSKWIEV